MIAASSALVAAIAVPNILAQERSTAQKTPGQPDPNDRGGEFVITGCVQPQPGAAGQPTIFKVTSVSPGRDSVGEGRVVGAMGGGTPVTGVTHSSAAEPNDPPDIVKGEYRIIATERTDLAKFANQKIEARGRLRDSLSSDKGAKTDARAKTSSGGAADAVDIFEATSVRKIAGTCGAK